MIVGIPVVYLLLLALDWNRVGSTDLDQFVVFHELQYWNWRLFGFAKQWTPVLCSGLSLAGEPQVPLLSLSMLLSYSLGPLRGIQLAVVIYLVWGWAGAYLYAGLCTRLTVERALAASLFIGNGFFICRIGHGHIDFVPFLVLPFVLWLLHRCSESRTQPPGRRYLKLAASALLLAAVLSLVIDGSPVSILHLWFWVACYALVLSMTKRCAIPLCILATATLVAALLDAGYLWPMLVAQSEFPRHLPETFTNPLALLWFMLLPVTGRLIGPANGNGHELTVFIGPIIALALWKYRQQLLSGLPADMRYPLLAVGLLSIVLGMGSLHAIDVPIALSPFDWLRPLPGFRSMGVTGRYWGFLALPLSLLGALALRRFFLERHDVTSSRRWMIWTVLLQFGFQIVSLVQPALPGHPYLSQAEPWSPRNGEAISYVFHWRTPEGELVTPTRGVIDCYDNDDFRRADSWPGSDLIESAHVQGVDTPLAMTARFMTWNRIRIEPTAPLSLSADVSSPVRIVLDQAYHELWGSDDCELSASGSGNLVARCPASALRRGPMELQFHDPVSELGARISIVAWITWLLVMAILAMIRRFLSSHDPRALSSRLSWGARRRSDSAR